MLSRRNLLISSASVPLAAVAGAASAYAALPVCDMEAVVKAAQIDPRRPDTTITPGSKASVLLVEDALLAEGLLASTYVDGHFGTKTIDAYAAWQRSLGFSGLDASGLPGQTSLKALGQGRFTVVKLLSPGSRVTFRGVTVNTRTKAMLLEG